MKKDLTKGSIKGHLFTLAAPMVIGILASMSFNIVDTYFIGQLGVDQLTAISFSFPIVMTLLNIAIGFTIGINSVLSRAMKIESEHSIKSISTFMLYLSIILGGIISLIGILTTDELFSMLGAKENHLEYINEYMLYAYPAMGLRFIAVTMSGTYRAHGITSVPSKAILFTSILNLIFDPLLIFGYGFIPALGIEGAGIATLIANLMSLLYELYIAIFRYHFFTFSISSEIKTKLKEIFSIALPASLSNALNPLSLNFVNYLLANQYEAVKVAGFGVAMKIQFFSMVPILAMSAAIGPIIGQNFGNDNFKRVMEAIKYALVFCLLWGAVQFIALYFFSSNLIGYFTDKPEAISFGVTYLKVIGFSLFGYSFVIICSSVMNSINEPIKAFFYILGRTFILFIIFYYSFIAMELENPIVYSIALSNVLMGIISYIYSKKRIEKYKSK